MSSTQRKTTVAILGAAGTGLFMAETVERIDAFGFLGFLDDCQEKRETGYCGYRVLGPLSAWKALPDDCLLLTSLYGAKRTPRFLSIVQGLTIPDNRWAVVIDPRATVSPRAQVGVGTFVGPNCVVEPLAVLGRWCALLGNVYVAHHTRLGDYVACSNNASLAGGITAGDATYFGANCSVREYIDIGARAVIGAGAVVVKNVLAGNTVVGNPARPLPRLSSDRDGQ